MCAIECVTHDLSTRAGTVEESNLVAQTGKENGDVGVLHRLTDRSREMVCVGAGFGVTLYEPVHKTGARPSVTGPDVSDISYLKNT